MILTFSLFLLSAAAIYFACEYFVNGIEWVGRQMSLGSTATGSVLAAFGTALPETAVTFAAVVFGANDAQRDIGVGAALGGPLVLATIAYALVGGALLLNRRRLGRGDSQVKVDCGKLAADQFWFIVIFAFKVGLGLVVFAFKPVLGALFLGAYALYVWREIRSSGAEPEDTEELEPLKFRPRDAAPARHWALLQSGLALLVITVASKVFVGQLEQIGHFFGLSAQLVALLLSPVATELPEAMNALIWVRQGRERLALANISGSMMIQGTIPTALGLFFTPWHLDPALVVSAVYTGAATLLLFVQFRRGRMTGWQLLPAGLLYVAFAATLPLLHAPQ